MKESGVINSIVKRLAGALKVAGGVTSATIGLTGCTWDKVEQPKVVCFESEILPIATSYCGKSGCHGGINPEEDYDFTTYAGIMAAVRPGKPSNSDFYSVLSASGEDKMPPDGNPQPTSEQITLIYQWITEGADNTTDCASVGCDTAAVVTYSGDIAPLMQSYCNGCHGGGSPSAGLDLSSYTTVKQVAQIGRLQGAMRGEPGFKVMPPSGNLVSSCFVDKIDKWVAAGAPNN